MAVSPDGKLLVATSESASLVHFIDIASARLADSVLVGTRPRDARFSADGTRLWVSSETRATVAIFDAHTHKLLHTIDFDRDPAAPERVRAVGIVLAPDGQRAFVALGRGNHVAEVDARSGRILRYYPVGTRNWGIALSPDQRRLYAANGLSGDLTIIDLAGGDTTTLRLGGKPWGAVSAP